MFEDRGLRIEGGRKSFDLRYGLYQRFLTPQASSLTPQASHDVCFPVEVRRAAADDSNYRG
jgi:hypothetical protein